MQNPPTPPPVANNNYSWEEDYKRSWDIIQEDETGSLQPSVTTLTSLQKRKHINQATHIQRGLVRYMVLVLDLSTSSKEPDYHPSRAQCIISLIHTFLLEFFDQNPISQIALVVTFNESAFLLTSLSSHPFEHFQKLTALFNSQLVSQADLGEPSLLNVLKLCSNVLVHVPSHGTRETLIISSSLTTCDHGDINQHIDLMKCNLIKVSVISLAAEIRIFRVLVNQTRGRFAVAMNEAHLKDLFIEHIPPPQLFLEPMAQKACELIQMGFPEFRVLDTYSLCACHNTPLLSGFICPQCHCMICTIPNECVVCGLNLVLSPHLARTYHHLFPISNYEEVIDWNHVQSNECAACMIALPPTPDSSALLTRSTGRYECPKCNQQVCIDCDIYIHDVLKIAQRV